jgi:hypothetical protein
MNPTWLRSCVVGLLSVILAGCGEPQRSGLPKDAQAGSLAFVGDWDVNYGQGQTCSEGFAP